MSLDDLTEDMKAVLYVKQAVDDLVSWGYVGRRGGGPGVTAGGTGLFDQLAASGWRPSARQVALALKAAFPAGSPLAALGVLVLAYAENCLPEQGAEAG